MEKKLRQLLDFQRFAGNKRLDAFIKQAEESYEQALSDEEIGLVNAAGDSEIRYKKKDILNNDE